MGLIHPDKLLTKAGAKAGDVLLLTKPLGVGMITTALKADVANPDHIAPAIASMKRLNREAMRLIQEVGVHACTDITGFSLLGHGSEMAEKSGVQLRFFVEQIPFLEGARQYAEDWLFPAVPVKINAATRTTFILRRASQMKCSYCCLPPKPPAGYWSPFLLNRLLT